MAVSQQTITNATKTGASGGGVDTRNLPANDRTTIDTAVNKGKAGK
ncbi:hypothetical protein [Roseovarius tolerans]|nr:hypothetical protein [Roseovarius tolerans]